MSSISYGDKIYKNKPSFPVELNNDNTFLLYYFNYYKLIYIIL